MHYAHRRNKSTVCQLSIVVSSHTNLSWTTILLRDADDDDDDDRHFLIWHISLPLAFFFIFWAFSPMQAAWVQWIVCRGGPINRQTNQRTSKMIVGNKPARATVNQPTRYPFFCCCWDCCSLSVFLLCLPASLWSAKLYYYHPITRIYIVSPHITHRTFTTEQRRRVGY